VTESSVTLPLAQGGVALNATESILVNKHLIEDHAAGRAIDCLREQTSNAHRELDETLQIIERLSVPERRGRLLLGYHSLHCETEAKVVPFLAEIADLDFSARRRSSLIVEGLGILDQNTLLGSAASLDIRTRAEACGALYVFEGSSLGGRFIVKELKRRGVSLAGLGFLDLYGIDTGRRWQSFLAILEREIKSCVQRTDAVTGALNTFAFAELCLCKENIN
jgi:heme oxygenase (biliverdin-IX-beta and delta-forming)